MADGSSEPAVQGRSALPPAAVQRAREIAESAPVLSPAKQARIRALLYGTLPPVSDWVEETVAAAQPVSDELCADLRRIIWSSGSRLRGR